MKKKKLITTIVHSFEVESEILLDLNFDIDVSLETSNKKKTIINIHNPKSKSKINTDASTRLF